MIVLGIESSCDETGVAIYDGDRGRLLAERLHSQVKTHSDYGGVVPELAARDHVRRLPALTRETLAQAKLAIADVEAVAYTAGPGLAGALLGGACFAQALAAARDIPALGVHHMEAHLLAPFLESAELDFPFAALLISGGHTLLIEARGVGDYHVLGRTLDDAAGEAFDKVGRLLGLGYPGGPAVSAAAAKCPPEQAGQVRLSRPMPEGLDFSFSGLKTQVARAVAADGALANDGVMRIARAFEETMIECLSQKCRAALERSGARRLVAAGGVAANESLRRRLREVTDACGATLFTPSPALCTDNGAMIAYAGWRRLAAGERVGGRVEVRPRWSLVDLSEPASPKDAA